MNEFLQMLSKEDVYKIIIPIVLLLLGEFFSYIRKGLSYEKQWRYGGEMSVCIRYRNYFLKMVIIEIPIFITYCAFVVIIAMLPQFRVTELFVTISYPIFNTIAYIIIFLIPSKIKLDYRINIRNEKRTTCIMAKIPIIISWLMWTSSILDFAEILWTICTMAIFIHEIVFLYILDDKRVYKYDCASFYFYKSESVKDIKTSNIIQKGNWIIAKGLDDNCEYRFRVRDIERIEYRS